MIYRTFGRTQIETSAIGFGGMRFKQDEDIETCAELVKAAYDRGINFFDTAPAYERSEEIFGIAIKEMKKDRSKKPFYVSTKTRNTDAGQIERQLETSLLRMNLDYIDFYHVWCVMSLDEYEQRKMKGVLKTFERLKERGLIRHISISTHAKGAEIEKILADYPFESVLLGYSAMNFAYRQQGLDAAARQNCAVVVMNPLGGGLIPKNSSLFSFLKTRQDETAAEAALRFLLNDRRITVVLVGFSSAEQIDEAVSAVDGFRPIATQTIQKIRAGLSESFNQLCTACGYCDDCPQGINIPRLMDAYNHLILGGTAASGQDLIGRLQFNWGYDLDDDFLSECTQCGCCEKKCTQNLPICERLQIIRSEVRKFLNKQSKK
jgi:uncharacterized protein